MHDKRKLKNYTILLKNLYKQNFLWYTFLHQGTTLE